MEVKDFVDAGLRCPSCGSKKLRAGYHEFQLYDSWICEACGYRWREDIEKERYDELLVKKLSESPMREFNKRLIWVLHVADNDKPLKNPAMSDSCTYKEFIKGTP